MTAVRELAPWQSFVIANGKGVENRWLATITGADAEEIAHLKSLGVCDAIDKPLGYAALFALWHGREPGDDDWPSPNKTGSNGTYEWFPPEEALLASLVGVISQSEIAEVLTERIRAITGDATAERTRNAVQVRTNRLGLATTDVTGGITISTAGREIGALVIVQQAVSKGELTTRRVGRLHVIPHGVWESWKAAREFPPEGYIQLSTLREPLGIRSDKLSEYAKLGLIPNTKLCSLSGVRGPRSRYGTWWIDQKQAEKILLDRREGRPMPWSGRYTGNLKTSFARWQRTKHPDGCVSCKEIWGDKGAPTTFEEFVERYPALASGAKRHLTCAWNPGLTIEALALEAGVPLDRVKTALANGALQATDYDGVAYVTRTDATRWIKARKCPDGEARGSWMSLQNAVDTYLFSEAELLAHIAAGNLRSKIGDNGPMRNITYVLRQQVGELRRKEGFSDEEAARRLGITVERLKHLLDGVAWRGASGIPIETLNAIRKRLDSEPGYTFEEAAAAAGRTVQWVKQRIAEGFAKASQKPWDRRRTYLSPSNLRRLLDTADQVAKPRRKPEENWISLSDAALEAGISSTKVNQWANDGLLKSRKEGSFRLFHREAIRAMARQYWQTPRRNRAKPPQWLVAERQAA